MTTFAKKIKRFETKLNTSRKYYERVWRLTEGFYNNHGNRLGEMLEDLKVSHPEEFANYCSDNGWVKDIELSDLFAY